MPGTPDFIIVPTSAGNKNLQTWQNTVSSTSVETEAVTLTDSAGVEKIGQKASAASLPVVIASDQSAVLVSGSVSAVVSGTVAVSNFPATQTVSGAVSVSNFPATQPISAAALPLPTGAATSSNQTNGTQVTQVSNFPATQPVSGTVTAVQTLGANLHANVDNFPAVQPVTGSTTWNLGVTLLGALTTASAAASVNDRSFTLRDSSGNAWALTIDNSGFLYTSLSGIGPTKSLILNDPTNATSWQIGITSAGQLTTTPVALGSYPISLALNSTVLVAVTQATTPWATTITNLPAIQLVSQSTNPWTVAGQSPKGFVQETNPDLWTLINIQRQILVELRAVRLMWATMSGQHVDDDDLDVTIQ